MVDYRNLPGRAFHKRRAHRNHRIRSCADNRAYVAIPWTIRDDVQTGDYAPTFVAHRDFYIANIRATLGKHNSATHPDDGTPSGQSLVLEIRRISADELHDGSVIGGEDLAITVDHHKDAFTNVQSSFAIDTLRTGDSLYPRVLQVGSGRPGKHLQVTVMLVPVRGHL